MLDAKCDVLSGMLDDCGMLQEVFAGKL